MSDLQIADGRVVIIHYTLRSEEDGVIDSSRDGEPLAYLQGAENVVAGLEKGLAGKAIGFKGEITVDPVDGYGEREDEPPQVVPRNAFPDDIEVEAGMQFMAEGPNDEHAPIWIVGVEGDQIFVDSQHPLAGKTLVYDVEVVGIREPTSDELEHGHPHGADGHDHHHHH